MHRENKKCLQSLIGKVRIKYLRDLDVDWRDLLKFNKKKGVYEDVHWI
jgi:hypothetical protein